MRPSLILHNARIHTGVPGAGPAEALAVWRDRLACVGASADVLATAGPQTRVVDLQGRCVTPGLTDCHVHLRWLALQLGGQTIQLDGAHSVQEVLARVRAALPAVRPGGWLRGHGWDKNQWADARFPTAAELDAVTGDIPAALASHDGHSQWVNSAALRLAGVTAESVDPLGGRILRDANGAPTGVLQEAASGLIWEHVPTPTVPEVTAALAQSLPRLNALGLTGLHNCDGVESRRAAQALRAAGKLTVRLAHYCEAATVDHLIELAVTSGLGDEWERLAGVKIFVDGALGGQTAAMLEPYEGSADAGLLTMASEEFAALATRATEHSLALAVHAIGDRAVRMVLDGFAHARVQHPGAWPRHRIEHAQHVHPDDQPRFGALGVIASVQPAHLLADIPTTERHLGARGPWAFPFRSLLAGGAALLMGSDAPVETVDPLVGIRAAMQRCDHNGRPPEGWHPEQRLTAAETLHGYTLAAAEATGETHLKGSLEAGKLADLVVWSHDLLAAPADELAQAKALATVVGGVAVHDPEGLFGVRNVS